VKAFARDVNATVDVGNTLIEEGVHVNATTKEFSTLNESNINIYEPEGLVDPARGGLIVEGGTAGIVSTHIYIYIYIYLHMPPVHKYTCAYDSLCCLAVTCVTFFFFFVAFRILTLTWREMMVLRLLELKPNWLLWLEWR
jgi:hypothetical protein